MQKQEMREQAWKRSLLWIVCVLLVIFSVAACANNGANPSPTSTSPPESLPTLTPFTVTSVDLAVNPNSIAGQACGSAVQFTYTVTFHMPEGTAGGKIEFLYTTNNGRSSTSASVNVGPGETTKVFTFSTSGALPPDHTYPGVAQVQVISPNAINSPQVIPAGTCIQTGAFAVTSVDLAVTPNSIAGRACGSPAQFTYTVTFHIPANTAGGKIEFGYTTNNGRSSTSASVNVGPGETTKIFTFSSSGTLPPDHTYPGVAQVQVTSPNAINSPQVIPAGTCVQAGTFAVTSIDMAVQPTSIAGKACGTAITVTYTATFHIAANSPGGTIQFLYTWNNGRASPSASVQVAPGQTTATYSFTWSGILSPDHVLPSYGGVIVTSPNAISSPMVKPDGACS